eukprot:CAMPEP_0118935804 /NCGR_PEP_ID=MMETSP1169-20130426/15838_1 /TAXON_ID=36882 /ORGANISM="Pyramimonas obovata, Strain CCMP722" /LENGTH=389 /DNA_ID=CAMNT_0006878867 /DNA_START=156 /DNA_END=1325 /DNA_ORIENTATION=+
MIVVIKVGTSSLIREDTDSVNLSCVARLCETVALIHSKGHRVVVVTSGAVGVGAQCMSLKKRPTEIPKKQALAAIGQGHLMKLYDDNFNELGKQCAQVLITLENIADRSQYLNTRQTFKALFEYGVIPIVNENDTVSVHELRIGDNDTMASQVASLIGADYCFLLTDVDGLYTANPNSDPNAKFIEVVDDLVQLSVDTGNGAGTEFGTGGMATKLTAARIATAAGCKMVICNSNRLEDVHTCLEGAKLGTLFMPMPNVIQGRKRWILSMPARGRAILDAGACRAVCRHKNVFPCGLKEVHGTFSSQDAIHLVSEEGEVIASGLVNYNNEEMKKLVGLQSDEIEEVLGFHGPSEILHRHNVCVFKDVEEEMRSEIDRTRSIGSDHDPYAK